MVTQWHSILHYSNQRFVCLFVFLSFSSSKLWCATSLENSTQVEEIKIIQLKKLNSLTALTVNVLNAWIRLMRCQMRLYWGKECAHVHTSMNKTTRWDQPWHAHYDVHIRCKSSPPHVIHFSALPVSSCVIAGKGVLASRAEWKVWYIKQSFHRIVIKNCYSLTRQCHTS